MSTKRILISYIGTVRGLQSHLAAQTYPGKVVNMEEFRKKEKPPRQRRSGGSCKVLKFSIPKESA